MTSVCQAAPGLEFQGNLTFDARRLRRVMLLGNGAENIPESLAVALERLSSFYRRNGFIEARVEFIKSRDWALEDGIGILVNEGPRYRVGRVFFPGNSKLLEQKLLKSISNRPGKPYNPDAQGSDEFKIMMAYADQGYVFAGVETSVDLLPDTTAELTFNISEGKRVRLGSLRITGNSFTSSEAIAKWVKIIPGKYFSRKAMLDGELTLGNAGLFSQVKVQPGAVSQDSQYIDVEISLAEKPRRRFETGLGYGSGDAFRVTTRWLNCNLGGWGQRLEFSGLTAVQLWRNIRLVRARAQASYREPWLFRKDLPGQALLYYDDHRPPYTDYRLQTVGFELDIIQRLSPETFVDWRASQQWLRLSPNWRDPGIPSDTIKYHGRRSVFAGWSLSKLDDPLMPKQGFSAVVEGEYTGGIFGEVNTFQRISATGIGYFSLEKPRTTFACRLRGGIIGDWSQRHVVPYYERYYLGGPTTLRGYPNGKAGSLAVNGVPQGGKKMVLMNFEARPAIYKRWLASLFLDIGILSDSPLRKMSFKEAYTSPGTGLRYVLPLGTGRLDLSAPGSQMKNLKSWKMIVAWGEVF